MELNKAQEMDRTRADKEQFVYNLGWLLSQTREGIEGCQLMEDADLVAIKYENGYKQYVNIALDSYAAIIRDVMRRV